MPGRACLLRGPEPPSVLGPGQWGQEAHGPQGVLGGDGQWLPLLCDSQLHTSARLAEGGPDCWYHTGFGGL